MYNTYKDLGFNSISVNSVFMPASDYTFINKNVITLVIMPRTCSNLAMVHLYGNRSECENISPHIFIKAVLKHCPYL